MFLTHIRWRTNQCIVDTLIACHIICFLIFADESLLIDRCELFGVDAFIFVSEYQKRTLQMIFYVYWSYVISFVIEQVINYDMALITTGAALSLLSWTNVSFDWSIWTFLIKFFEHGKKSRPTKFVFWQNDFFKCQSRILFRTAKMSMQ